MTYLCVDKDGTERIIECEVYCGRGGDEEPYRDEECWDYDPQMMYASNSPKANKENSRTRTNMGG